MLFLSKANLFLTKTNLDPVVFVAKSKSSISNFHLIHNVILGLKSKFGIFPDFEISLLSFSSFPMGTS